VPTPHPHEVGRAGEELAAAWYAERGYEVLARNWRCPAGEADLLLWQGGTLVVCEVKARSGARYGPPAEAVGRLRQQRLRRTAAHFLQAEREREGGLRARVVRFDVAEVMGDVVSVIEDAFRD
jgi:putative endonuclease